MGQRHLAVRSAAQPGTEQHVRAVFHQRYEAELRERALATARAWIAKAGAVLGRVGHIQAGAVQAHQPPPSIPRPLGGARRHRQHDLLVEPAQRHLAQAAARLRDAALARDLDRVGAPQPAQALQQAAQHLAGAGPHVQRHGDGVVHHHLRRQVALALARPAGLGQNLLHPVRRERLGDHAEADVVADTNAGWKAGGNTRHRCRSQKTRPVI